VPLASLVRDPNRVIFNVAGTTGCFERLSCWVIIHLRLWMVAPQLGLVATEPRRVRVPRLLHCLPFRKIKQSSLL
jgi:hypothetical protein